MSSTSVSSAAAQSEQILVVPTELFHSIGHFQGFSTDVDRYLGQLLDPANISFRPRSEMETDPSFKQLIPYVVFRHTDEHGCQRIFHYKRGKGQGESRLHSKVSVGIGGHISDEDLAGSGTPYQEGMRRELEEEVEIDTKYVDRCIGLINDDETDVGKVHLGVVHLFDCEEPKVAPRESEILSAGFEPTETLFGELDRMETWSSIVLQSYFAK